MHVTKIKITAAVKILILILLMLTGYFIWIAFSPAKPKSEQVRVPPASEKPVYKSVNKMTPSEKSEKIIPTSIVPFFENVYEVAKNIETKLKNEIATTTKAIPNVPNAPSSTPSNTSVLKPMSTEIILSLTEDEFHFLYPDTFITSLMDAQNLFIKSYDPAYEPLLKIETDSQVRYVEEKIVAALLATNVLTKEEAGRAIATIRFTLPQLQLMDLKNQNSSAANQPYRNQCSIPPPRPSLEGLFLAGLMEKLYNACIPKAQAVCGACFYLPECFQPGAFSPLPGPNIFRVACYCTGCYYGQGCLDFCTGREAIYDPMTGICGCG